MNTLNHPIITFFALAGFIWLALQSHEKGYSESERASMDKLVASVTMPQTNAEKIVYLFGGDE